MNVLVTGGAGFIGSHVVAALAEGGAQVRVLDDLSTGSREHLHAINTELIVDDVADPRAVSTAIRDCDVVIHLAAQASVPASCADPVACERANGLGAVVVFEAARRASVRRVVYASSSAVYGNTPTERCHEELPLRAESPYAASKAADELYASAFSTLGLSCIGLRYFNVFGPRQSASSPYSGVIARFVDAALRGTPLCVFGDGGQSRDFIAVADVVRATLRAASASGVTHRVYNIGGGRARSVLEVAETVRGAVGRATAIVHQPARAGDVRYSVADISRASADLGWRPVVEFSAALQELIRWRAMYL